MAIDVFELIEEKQKGASWAEDEIGELISEYSAGQIPETEMAGLLMASSLQGMEVEELEAVTEAVLATASHQIDLKDFAYPAVALYDTGGMSSKENFVAMALAASYGVQIGILQEQRIGYFGGLIDKLSALTGFQSRISLDEYEQKLRSTGLVVGEMDASICQGMVKLNQLAARIGCRSSVEMSAVGVLAQCAIGGTKRCVFNIKVGRGAWVRTVDRARKISSALCQLGQTHDIKMCGFITSTENPTGQALGNALEIREVIQVLKNEGPADVAELATALAGQMLVLGQRTVDLEKGKEMAAEALANGQGFEKFKAFVLAQGGDEAILNDPDLMPVSPRKETIRGLRPGYVKRIDAWSLTKALQALGATTPPGGTEAPDPRVGLVLHKKIGDQVTGEEPLVTIYYSDQSQIDDARCLVEESYLLSPSPAIVPPMIYETVR